jgi:hypothetical protein
MKRMQLLVICCSLALNKRSQDVQAGDDPFSIFPRPFNLATASARIFRATVVQLAKNIGRTAVGLAEAIDIFEDFGSNLNIETFWRSVEMKLAL